MIDDPYLLPDWPAPSNIKALTTYRHGGYGQAPYESFNLASHVDDNPEIVEANRAHLIKQAKLPTSPLWLQQTHSTIVIDSQNWYIDIVADGLYSSLPNHVCSVLTADCLPILLCDKTGTQVAAVHAGWRGLANGIVEQAISHFDCSGDDILVWLGPAIGPNCFEVGHDVVSAFVDHDSEASNAFQQTDPDHFLADIYQLARLRLHRLGIHDVFGGTHCTVSESEQFFSYRRENITGRMATLIWIANT